jgi:hypothetical protein
MVYLALRTAADRSPVGACRRFRVLGALSAALGWQRALVMGGSVSHDIVVVTACSCAACAAAVPGEHLGA